MPMTSSPLHAHALNSRTLSSNPTKTSLRNASSIETVMGPSVLSLSAYTIEGKWGVTGIILRSSLLSITERGRPAVMEPPAALDSISPPCSMFIFASRKNITSRTWPSSSLTLFEKSSFRPSPSTCQDISSDPRIQLLLQSLCNFSDFLRTVVDVRFLLCNLRHFLFYSEVTMRTVNKITRDPIGSLTLIRGKNCQIPTSPSGMQLDVLDHRQILRISLQVSISGRLKSLKRSEKSPNNIIGLQELVDVVADFRTKFNWITSACTYM